MVPRENKNNAYAKFGGTNKEYYGIFQSGLYIKREIGNLFTKEIEGNKNYSITIGRK